MRAISCPGTALQTRAIALLVLLTLVVFGGSLAGGFVWDDPSLILRDTRSFGQVLTTGFWAGSGMEVAQDFYRPAVSAALWLERALFGEGAFGYHLVSVLLHLACVLLAWRWLQRRLGGAMVPALLGALLFALHPSRVESVAWISGSTDLWLTFWLLLGFEAKASRARGAAVLAFACWLLAALSKETGILVPLLVAADHLLLERKGGGRALAPAALAAVVALALRGLVVASPALGGLASGDAIPRVLASAGYYVRSAFWPWTPTVTVGAIDPAVEGAWLLPAWAIATGAVAALTVAALAVAALRRPALRPWLADAAWLVVPLLPVLNLFPLGYQTFVAERFLYLPLLGLAALLARLLVTARSERAQRGAAAVAGVFVLACAGASTLHVAHFLDDVELWSYERAVHPDDPRVGKWLAQALLRAGENDAARAELLASLEQTPPAWNVLRAELAVEWGVLESVSGPDAEQERLIAARTVLDTLAELPAAEKISLEIGGKRHELVLNERVRARLAASKPLRDHRILAHLRTLSLETAESLAAALARAAPHAAYVANHALVLLAAERWDDAQRVLAAADGDARAAKMQADLASFRQRLIAATDHEAILLRATFLKDQGLRAAARRTLASVLDDAPRDPALIELAVRIDLEDGVPRLARQRLERLTAESPDERWRQLLGEVDAWERRLVASGE